MKRCTVDGIADFDFNCNEIPSKRFGNRVEGSGAEAIIDSMTENRMLIWLIKLRTKILVDNRVSKKGSFKIYYKIISLTRRFVGSYIFVFFLLRNRNLFTSLQYDWIWKAPQFLQKCQKKCGNKSSYFSKIKIFCINQYFTYNCLYSLFFFSTTW